MAEANRTCKLMIIRTLFYYRFSDNAEKDRKEKEEEEKERESRKWSNVSSVM